MAISKLFSIDVSSQIEAIVEETEFAPAVRAHDRLLSDAVKAWQKADEEGRARDKKIEGAPSDAQVSALVEKALFAHNLADVCKTIIRMKWPEASLEWFGEERR